MLWVGPTWQFSKDIILLTFIVPWAVNFFSVVSRSTFLCFLISRLIYIFLLTILPLKHTQQDSPYLFSFVAAAYEFVMFKIFMEVNMSNFCESQDSTRWCQAYSSNVLDINLCFCSACSLVLLKMPLCFLRSSRCGMQYILIKCVSTAKFSENCCISIFFHW